MPLSSTREVETITSHETRIPTRRDYSPSTEIWGIRTTDLYTIPFKKGSANVVPLVMSAAVPAVPTSAIYFEHFAVAEPPQDVSTATGQARA